VIPDWLEKYRKELPEYESVKGKKRAYALLQEVYAHYFWLYASLEIDERQDRVLRNQFAQMQRQFDAGTTGFNAGTRASTPSVRAREICETLMPEAVKHESKKDAVRYLRDQVNSHDPSIVRSLDLKRLRRICNDYFRDNRLKYRC
jgi:hypothetical protein